MLLNGVIDCPDIPLNVSRSFLQNDREVQKISKHITKKVAEKLTSLFKNDREKYNTCWEDTSNFIKFGCIKDEEFYNKVKDIIIYKDLDGNFVNFKELLGEEEIKEPKTVYYASDELQQAQYIKMFKDAGLKAILCDTFIDPHYLSFIEYKTPDKLKFMRIDADIDGALKDGDGAEDSVLAEIFKNAIGDDKVTVKFEKLKSNVPALIIADEFMRRYAEMGQLYGMSSGDIAKTMIVNIANPLIGKLKDLSEEKQKFVAGYVYSLALLSFKKLEAEELDKFINANLTLLEDYVK